MLVVVVVLVAAGIEDPLAPDSDDMHDADEEPHGDHDTR